MLAPVPEISGTRKLGPSAVAKFYLPKMKTYQPTGANFPNPSFTNVGEDIKSNTADIILCIEAVDRFLNLHSVFTISVH